jgi:hypothetical protein
LSYGLRRRSSRPLAGYYPAKRASGPWDRFRESKQLLVRGCINVCFGKPSKGARRDSGRPLFASSEKTYFINAPEGCQRDTHTNGTAYVPGWAPSKPVPAPRTVPGPVTRYMAPQPTAVKDRGNFAPSIRRSHFMNPPTKTGFGDLDTVAVGRRCAQR